MSSQGASSGPGQGAGKSFVQFSRGAAQRIAKTVRTVEQGDRNQPGITFDHPIPSSPGRSMRLGKTTATWTKGTLATIALWESGTAPNETSSSRTIADCVNKFATVAANKWVALARGPGGRHYLIAAEC